MLDTCVLLLLKGAVQFHAHSVGHVSWTH